MAPGHQDVHASLDVHPERGFVCRACGAKGGLRALAIRLGLEEDTPPRRARRPRLTLEALAADKRLPVEFLRQLGLTEEDGAIRIPYFLADGSLAPRQRRRTALRAGKGSSWYPGEGSPVPYGLSRLQEAREVGYMHLWEGESDTWTAWFHGLPSLGIPGANMVKCLEREHLEGITKLYVASEPDVGGETFIAGMAARLAEIGWTGQAWVIHMPDGIKDLNALHCDAPERFVPCLKEVFYSRTPLPPATPGRPDAAPSDAVHADPPDGESPFGDPTDLSPQGVGYRVKDGGIWRERPLKGGQMVLEEVAPNFVARIAEEQLLDDGRHEPEKVLLIEGRTATGEALPRVAVPAAEVDRLTWLAKSWPEACDLAIGQNTGAHLHRAMRRLFPGWPRRRIFTHTGWRELTPGQWGYVTTEGAVGTSERVEVDLEPKLRSYALPTTPVDEVGAVRTSLSFWELAPLQITVPLWAGVYRAPLCEVLPVDFVLWVEGQSGTLKTSTALVALAHFGRFQDKRDVPASWLDTATRLEQRAHAIKDAVLLIDDYVKESDEMEGKATRMVRSFGNATSRGRSSRDLKAQPDFPPRGLVLATAEHRPGGLSLSARLLVLQFRPDSVDRGRLTALQRAAGRLPHAVTGYCWWLAPKLADAGYRAELRSQFERTRDKIRDEAGATLLRVHEALAHLWLGIEQGLAYAEAIGALDQKQAMAYRENAWTALLGIRGTQAAEVEGQRETRRFLGALQALLVAGRAKLLPQRDSWEGYSGRAHLVGWENDEYLFLIPDAAYTAVQGELRTAGRPLQVDLERLIRSLAEDGVAVKDLDGKTRKRVKIAGKVRRVVCLIRKQCAALAEDESWLGTHTADSTPAWVNGDEPEQAGDSNDPNGGTDEPY